MNAEAFMWNEIYETLIRKYGAERGAKIGDRASRTQCKNAKGIAKAIANAIEWERRQRVTY